MRINSHRGVLLLANQDTELKQIPSPVYAVWSAGGGDREDMALSYVFADSGCVAARWLCVL